VAHGTESVSPADNTGSALESRLRESFARSREIVMQAHERAQQSVDRAIRIREALQEQRSSVHPAQREARRRLRLLHLAVEESARSAREKDRFLATVSHELRQPLNAALAALRIVEIGRGDTAAAREILRRQLLQVTRMVEDLVDMSRMSLDRMELRLGHVNLATVLDDAVATIDPDLAPRDLTLTVVRLTSDVCVWGDESRLRQVFSNLLSNAVRYTPRGGRITISAAIKGAQVSVTVSDTGKGIKQEDLARIFDPFTRAGGSQDGFGIGLSLVRAIVELHRGTTEASSPGLDSGSTFIVTLPVCPHTNGETGSDVRPETSSRTL
jgi:signal transduction histidine kinase